MFYFKDKLCPECDTRTKKESLAALNKQTTVKSDFKVSVFTEENRFRIMVSKPHFSKGLYSMASIKVTKDYRKKCKEF